MRRVVGALTGMALILAAIVLVRTARFTSRQETALPPEPLDLDSARAVERLADAIRIPTVSEEDPSRRDPRPLLALHRLLEAEFPRVHAVLRHETVNQYSVLYVWPGADSGAPGVLLAAHLDVVPAESAGWSHPPFAGEIAEGYLWGRGTLDDKVGVVGLLEAVEALVGRGFRPRRTVYLAFGHDEEVGGQQGAKAIATLLTQRSVRLSAVVDEGGAVTRGVVPGVAAPVATVGIAEKGSVSVALVARARGGHSSMPPPRTAVGLLSRAIDRLEADPFPARLGSSRGLFRSVGPEMSWRYRALFANLWLFEPLILRGLTNTPSTAAAVRTTLAPTIIEGGTKDNVLPPSARAVVNLRILPGETVASVVARVRRVIDDSAVTVAIIGQGEDPSPVSPADATPFRELAGAIRRIHPDAVVAPYLVLGATDARHYAGLTANVYRFSPLSLTGPDLDRFHGVDERIGIADYLSAVRLYAQIIRQLTR